MVSQKKIDAVKMVKEQVKDHTIIGIVDMHKLPARQLLEIRNKIRSEARILMVKKRIMEIALKESGVKGLENLVPYIQGEPALLFSKSDPFKLARMISGSKSLALAKAGDIAPRDIWIRAGPTSLSAGPIIGELQKAKIKVAVDGEKLAVKEDVVVAKEGDVITKSLAGILSKFAIEPIEIGLNLVAVYSHGTIYGKDILFIPLEKYVDDIRQAGTMAFNLSVAMGWPTSDNIEALLSKANQGAMSLALEAGIVSEETIKPLIGKAERQAEALKAKAGI